MKMKKDGGKNQSGRVICDDDPTIFWMEKKLPASGYPNLTQRPSRKKPKGNKGEKTKRYGYSAPSQNTYPSLYSSRSYTPSMLPSTGDLTGQFGHNSHNILGRIDQVGQPRLPETITQVRSPQMRSLLDTMAMESREAHDPYKDKSDLVDHFGRNSSIGTPMTPMTPMTPWAETLGLHHRTTLRLQTSTF